VIVTAPNPEKKLMPGMTANITVLVQKIESVLIVPGKALRFTPDAGWLAEYEKNNPITKKQNRIGQHGSTGLDSASQRKQSSGSEGREDSGELQEGERSGKKPVLVWVKSGEKIHRTRIVTGAVDGSNAQLIRGLNEGDEVILSMNLPLKSATASKTPATATSPFMPQRPGTTRR
jgi:HlyD family secretion protein